MEETPVGIVDRLLEACVLNDGRVLDVRIGLHWTAVVAETQGRVSAGLAATLTPEGEPHGSPYVREAGRLKGASAAELAGLIRSEHPTERSIGLAALNALYQPEHDAVNEGNADEILFERGTGKTRRRDWSLPLRRSPARNRRGVLGDRVTPRSGRSARG